MNKDKKIRIFVLMQMILISIAAVSIPALITTFQKEYNLSIAQSAIIPIIGTMGGIFTNILIASISAKMGLKRLNLYFLGIGLIASATLAFSNNIYIFLLGIILVGINTAFGLTNVSTIFAHIEIKYQNYGVLHAFFGIGGIIAPAIISFLFTHSINYRYIYYLLIVLFAGFLVYVATSNLIENKKYENIKLKEAFSIIRKSFILPVLIIIALQAGSEQGIVMWSGNLLSNVLNYSTESASLFLSFYWIVFTAARLLIQFVEKPLGKLNTVKLSIVLVVSFLALLLVTNSPIFFVLLAAAMGPVFPLMQKYSAQKLPPREVGLFNGMVFAFASMGNVIIAG
ncbi:MAG: MFS transporter, partial [Candidatus Delongbacteria bacterium]|nr:MFS transporter [Candidatus Delongbacteria bacterium]